MVRNVVQLSFECTGTCLIEVLKMKLVVAASSCTNRAHMVVFLFDSECLFKVRHETETVNTFSTSSPARTPPERRDCLSSSTFLRV